jgi:glucose-1-phosphate thymidylyltransferase
VLEEGAVLENALVRGPAVIGKKAVIRNAFVGPYTAIGAGSRVENCEIENSIVWEGSEIRDIPVRIADSLIGRGVKIHRGELRPRVHRFLVGDNSEIGIV